MTEATCGVYETFRKNSVITLERMNKANNGATLDSLASMAKHGTIDKREEDAFWGHVRRLIDSHIKKFGCWNAVVGFEDIKQELYIRVINALPHYDTNRPFRPWFYTVIRNSIFRISREILNDRRVWRGDLGLETELNLYEGLDMSESEVEEEKIKDAERDQYLKEGTRPKRSLEGLQPSKKHDYCSDLDFKDAILELLAGCNEEKQGWIIAVFGDPHSRDFHVPSKIVDFHDLCNGTKDRKPIPGLEGKYPQMTRFFTLKVIPFLRKRFSYLIS